MSPQYSFTEDHSSFEYRSIVHNAVHLVKALLILSLVPINWSAAAGCWMQPRLSSKDLAAGSELIGQ
jgi:hypothetical protein